ncbi:Testis-specific serine/threonine-protein kinase 4 [Halotydeus destructor]|nr:Testis-specific serine/threonine-protein kinase 4 [Halotydeus destructor]
MSTKAMQKAQKKAQQEEIKAVKEGEKKARDKMDAEDQGMRQSEQDRLKANEAAINKETEEAWAAYLAADEAAEKEQAETKGAQLAQMAAARAASIKEKLPAILANEGAKKTPNEETLAAREKWAIIRTDIAKGAFANLYKAKDPTQKEIVVKVTPLKGDAKYCARYAKTFPALRYLVGQPHDHIVAIFEIFVTPEKAYVFMDMMDKVDMLQKIKKEGPFGEEQAFKWAREVGQGLEYLHSSGLAHENLKPDSILFDQLGRCKIGGLGSLVTCYDGTSDSVIKIEGNAKDKFHRHFAPEKRKADPYDPVMADIWSWGCLVVILVTKEWPFEEKSKHDLQLQWKLCFKKTGKQLTDTTCELLVKCFKETADQRAPMYELLDMIPAV